MCIQVFEYAHDGSWLPSCLELIRGILRPAFTSPSVGIDVGYTTCMVGGYFRPCQSFARPCKKLRLGIALEYRVLLTGYLEGKKTSSNFRYNSFKYAFLTTHCFQCIANQLEAPKIPSIRIIASKTCLFNSYISCYLG